MDFKLKILAMLIGVITISGCMAIASLPYTMPNFSAPLLVWRSGDFAPDNRVLVLLTRGPYDNNVKSSLTQNGFQVRLYAERSAYRKTRGYGLSFNYDRKQKCPTLNNEWLIKGFYEVSDLITDEVFLTIEKGGVTGPCGNIFRDKIFSEIATALSDSWTR